MEGREEGCPVSSLITPRMRMCVAYGPDVGVADGSCPKVVSKESHPRGPIDLVTPTESWTSGGLVAKREGIDCSFQGKISGDSQ